MPAVLPDSLFEGPPISEQTSVHRAALSTRSRKRADKKAKRLDIQGLRMIAVLAVVVNHLSGHPKGGFVGVDVFFVISGYLITGLLVRDLQTSIGLGRYLGNFYRRRIRRLFPAALLVIAGTIAVSHAILTSARYTATLHDGLWSAVFWANWHFVSLSTNYFTAGLPDSPFQHYWSLSVEEQFYVAWPIGLFVTGWLFARRNSASINCRRLVAGALSIVLIGISAWYAFGQSTSAPASAYFSTFTRGWELGLGALLACLVPHIRANVVILTGLSWLGMGFIVISLFTAHGGSGFPVPGAVLPCLGSALVIAAVSPSARARNAVLTNRGSVFVGDISYSVYLVHFPVIILLAAEMPEHGDYFYATALGLIFGVSALLYSLVERPILKSNWLLPKDRRSRERYHPPVVYPALAGITAVLLGLAAYAMQPTTPTVSAAVQRQLDKLLEDGTTARQNVDPPKLAALQTAIDEALKSTSWPALDPSLENLVADPGSAADPSDIGRCGSTALSSAKDCTFGPASATHTIYLTGDSTSVGYGEMFKKIVQSMPRWKVRVGAAYDCPFVHRKLKISLFAPSKCAAHNKQVLAEVKQTHPDLLVITNAYVLQTDADSGANLTDTEWGIAVQSEIKKVSASVGKVILLAPPPWGKDIRRCYTKGSTPNNCVTQPNATWTAREVTESGAADKSGAIFLDPTRWFCAGTVCPAFVGSTPTRADLIHMTWKYGDRIAPAASEALTEAGVFK